MIRNFKKDFEQIIKENKDAVALISTNPNNEEEETNITYSQLRELIAQTSALIKSYNLQEGDNLVVLLPNSIELAIIFFACVYCGINFIPLACDTTDRDINNIYNIVKPKLWIISKIVVDKYKNNENIKNSNICEICTDNSFKWLDENNANYDISNKTSNICLSTSGTTGEPKLMMINTDKLWSSGYHFMKHHNLLETPLKFWNYLPMSYLGGLFNLLMIPLITKGTSIITETFNGRTYLNFWQTIQKFDINAIWFTPSIVRGLGTFAQRMNEEDRLEATKNIKVCFLGTAPINLECKTNFEKMFNITLLENFALSETTFFTTENYNTISNRCESSVGEELEYVNIKIGSSEECPNEIFVKTPFLFEGYLTTNGLIKPEIDSEGYFNTQDVGYFNENNTLIIKGRNRDIIKKGGYFISLREIEILAEQNKYVKEAAAVKIPHEFYSESYNLYLILNEEVQIDIVEHQILENLIKYKWPEKIIVKKDFPRTSSGKVKKQLLKEEDNECLQI